LELARPLKADLHIHTGDDIYDNIAYSSKGLIDEAARQCFEVISITNHDCDFYTEELYEYAREQGILLIRGMELTYDKQHILLINFDDAASINTPEDVISRKKEENLVIAPHPYFPWAPSCGRLLNSRPELFDAVEYAHLYNKSINFNRKAVRRAAELGLPMVGTSDSHTLDQLGYTYTLIHAEKTPESVVAAVKAGRVELVTRPMTLAAFLWIIAKMKYGSAVRIIGDVFHRLSQERALPVNNR